MHARVRKYAVTLAPLALHAQRHAQHALSSMRLHHAAPTQINTAYRMHM